MPSAKTYAEDFSTTCVKSHQITDVISETIRNFSRHTSYVLFLAQTLVSTKVAHQSANFQTLYCSR